MLKIVAVIPALDEEGAIGAVVRDLPHEMLSQIIVVDNGSGDATAEAARAAGATVVAETRRGYGYACTAGVHAAPDADLYVFLDGDYSDYPEEAARLIDPIVAGRADVVLGSRTLGRRARGALTPQALAGNALAAQLIRRLDGVRITDLAPFKAVRGPLLRDLGLREMTYGWTIELIVRAAQTRVRIEEVPVSYRQRLAGQSKVSGTVGGTAKASARILLTLARLHLPPVTAAGRNRRTDMLRGGPRRL